MPSSVNRQVSICPSSNSPVPSGVPFDLGTFIFTATTPTTDGIDISIGVLRPSIDGIFPGFLVAPLILATATVDGPPTVCGDGLIAGAEACDDGGVVGGDGCDAFCETETGWLCEGEPSICSPDMTPVPGPGGLIILPLLLTGFIAQRRTRLL